MEDLIKNIDTFNDAKPDEYKFLLLSMNDILECNKCLADSVIVNLVDKEFINEIEDIVNGGVVGVYFGESLRDVKIVIPDESGLRSHNIFIQYKAFRKFIITNVNLPHSSIQNVEYRSLNDIIETFGKYINELARYFDELEHIDQFCSVMEPVNASFKDNFRHIFIDDRTWLHIEVTPEGLASNIHLVGHSVHWHNKLQSGLLIWDHDKNIIENIMVIFEFSTLPQATSKSINVNEENITAVNEENIPGDTLVCGICLCAEIPEAAGLPQPICQNVACGVYYHRSCLYQWLVACAGSRPPAFGVANGACPTCLQPVTCSEKDI